MAYGMQFTNNNDTVVLDSEFSRLVVIHKGDYSGPINFPTPITTQEPPLVFIRPSSSFTLSYARINGSAGNWTGFSFIGGGPVSILRRPFNQYPQRNMGFGYGMALESFYLIAERRAPSSPELYQRGLSSDPTRPGRERHR